MVRRRRYSRSTTGDVYDDKGRADGGTSTHMTAKDAHTIRWSANGATTARDVAGPDQLRLLLEKVSGRSRWLGDSVARPQPQ